MEKVIVTGSSGFLGRTLVDRLSAQRKDYQVYALTRSPLAGATKSNSCQINVLGYDAMFQNDAVSLVRDAIIVNCAFPRNTSGADFASGMDYVHRCFEAARDCGAKAVINISSQSVYSQKRTAIADEGTPISLESMYGVGKYSSELFLRDICGGMPFCNLRIASLIGPGFDQRVTNKLIDSAISARTLPVSRSNRRFGFMDVEDAAGGIAALLNTSPKSWKPVYTLGTGMAYGLEELALIVADQIQERLGYRPALVVKDIADEGNTGVSGRLFSQDTGFACEITIAEALETILSAKMTHLPSDCSRIPNDTMRCLP